MSCMIISTRALFSVKRTLISSYYWSTQTKDRPMKLYTNLWKNGNFPHCAVDVVREATKFVWQAYVFNAVEYFKGEQARDNAEPIEWGSVYEILQVAGDEALTPVQLYKTLGMIDYNTDPKGWLEPEEYDNWARRDEFEQFKETLKRLRNFLAEHIAKNTEEYKNAQWSIE